MRHLRRKAWITIVASLFIVNTLAVVTSKYFLPHVYRWRSIRQLTSDDAQVRAQAFAYIVSRHRADPTIVGEAWERIADAGDAIFVEFFLTLDYEGLWRREVVPTDAWLRWVGMVALDADAEERVRAAQLLADLPEMASDRRVLAVFEKLTADPQPEVRYNALVCAAELRGRLRPTSGVGKQQAGEASHKAADQYDAMMIRLAGDGTPMIARHAWMLLAFVSPESGFAADYTKAGDADVAEAMLFAALRTNPDAPAPAIRMLLEESAAPTLRAAAAFALSQSDAPAATIALAKLVAQGPAAVTEQNQLAFWRAILGIRLDAKPATAEPAAANAAISGPSPARAALLHFVGQCKLVDYHENALIRPLILACVFRDRRLLTDAALKGSEIVLIADDALAWLASLEGVPLAVAERRDEWAKAAPTKTMAPALALAAFRAMADPKPDHLLPLLAHDEAVVRDQACIAAVQRMTKDQVAALVRRLLQPPPKPVKGKDVDLDQPVFRYHDGAKISAAILSGLANVEAELVDRTIAQFADRPRIGDMMKLGQWMRTAQASRTARTAPQAESYAAHAEKMLMLDDFPRSTILLAMLHVNHPTAMDSLLRPRAEANPQTLRLLDEERWWFVLEHFLPPDAPRLWVWGDPQLARFQVDLMRDWYLLNRK